MTLDDFSQALFAALNRHFPQATVTFTTTRDITLKNRQQAPSYLLGDHLGLAAITANSSDAKWRNCAPPVG